MKNKQKNFHIRWILVGLLCGFYDIYLLRVSNIYPRNMYTGLWVSCVFCLSPTTMDPIKYIRTYDFKLFQVEVTSVTSV